MISINLHSAGRINHSWIDFVFAKQNKHRLFFIQRSVIEANVDENNDHGECEQQNENDLEQRQLARNNFCQHLWVCLLVPVRKSIAKTNNFEQFIQRMKKQNTTDKIDNKMKAFPTECDERKQLEKHTGRRR